MYATLTVATVIICIFNLVVNFITRNNIYKFYDSICSRIQVNREIGLDIYKKLRNMREL